MRPNGRVRYRVAENSGTAALSSTVLIAGTWYHLAGTWDGSRLAVFVNGVEEGSNIQAGGPGNATLEISRAAAIWRWSIWRR